MLLCRPALLLLVLVCSLPSLTFAQEVAEVYLLSGQSNMAGSGRKEQLPEHWQTPVPNVQYWNGEAFVTFDPGQLNLNGKDRFGPELGFAHTLGTLNPDQTFYIVKFALSGQPLHAGFHGGKWMGAEPGPNRNTFYPGEAADDPNRGNHYKRLHGQFSAALTALKQAGKTPRLRGIVWMQGEADAKQEVSALTYDQSIDLLKRRIEEDCASGPVPFVMGEILPHDPPLERFTHRSAIRQAQQAADMRSGSPRAISGVWNVSTDGMPLLADTVHYDTKGQLMLGTSFALGVTEAENMLQMLAQKKESGK
ncbi:sialate O-acetylesterase [Bremerella cremea]|nr:sialate O-acetylesterase [Bremerella cremea]